MLKNKGIYTNFYFSSLLECTNSYFTFVLCIFMFEDFSKSLHIFLIFQPKYKGMRVWLETFAQCCRSWKGTKDLRWGSLYFWVVCVWLCVLHIPLISYFVSTSKQTCLLLRFVCVRHIGKRWKNSCLCFHSHSYSPLVCDFSFWLADDRHISGLFFLVVFNRLQCSQSKYI